MTKQDKQTLKYLVANKPEKSDEYMARSCDCSVDTVKKYRKVWGKPPSDTAG